MVVVSQDSAYMADPLKDFWRFEMVVRQYTMERTRRAEWTVFEVLDEGKTEVRGTFDSSKAASLYMQDLADGRVDWWE